MSMADLLSKLNWKPAGVTVCGEVQSVVSNIFGGLDDELRVHALVVAAALAVEELTDGETEVPVVSTSFNAEEVHSAWTLLGAAAKAWTAKKSNCAADRPAWLRNIADKAVATVTARKSVSVPRDQSPEPEKPTKKDIDAKTPDPVKTPPPPPPLPAQPETRVRYKKCPGCTMRTSNCICSSMLSAGSAAEIVKLVRQSAARETDEGVELEKPDAAKKKPKKTDKPKKEPEVAKKSPDDSDSFRDSESDTESETATATGFPTEGRDSTYAHYWAKPSRLQDPTTWLQAVYEDGELNQAAFHALVQQLDRFGGYKEDPQSASDRLRNILLFNLQSWIRFAPEDPPESYLDVATHNLDQLMIQKAFDRGNTKSATKFMKRLEASEHSDRYRSLWDKMEKEAEQDDKKLKKSGNKLQKGAKAKTKDAKDARK
jgi:hypothetical protein